MDGRSERPAASPPAADLRAEAESRGWVPLLPDGRVGQSQ